jgi:hypothetical protein
MPVRSILTIRRRYVWRRETHQASRRRCRPRGRVKRLCTPANMPLRSMTVPSWRANRPGIVALAFLNPASPEARLDALSTNVIGLGKSRGGNIGRGGASPTSDQISQSCDADVQGPDRREQSLPGRSDRKRAGEQEDENGCGGRENRHIIENERDGPLQNGIADSGRPHDKGALWRHPCYRGRDGAPMLLVRRFTLNPVFVAFSFVFWFWLWGVPGAVLSAPILATTKIVCDRIRPLAALGHIISG